MSEQGYRFEAAKVVGESEVLDLTLSLDTSQYAAGDVLAAPQELQNIARLPGGRVKLVSVVALDEDDQGQDFDLVFMNADGALGNENAAVAPTDAVARTIVGQVTLSTWFDLGNSQQAILRDINLMLECAAGTTSLWIAAVCREGTPTYTAAGIRLKLGFERY